MYILVALGTCAAAWASCQAPLGSYHRRHLTPARLEEMIQKRVAIVHEKGAPTLRGMVVGAARTRDGRKTTLLRLWDEEANEVRELSYPYAGSTLKRVTVLGPSTEIEDARRRAGPDAEMAHFYPREPGARAIDGWLDLRHPLTLVVASNGQPGLEVLEGLVTLPTTGQRHGFASHLNIEADGRRREIAYDRLLAAFGRWAGF